MQVKDKIITAKFPGDEELVYAIKVLIEKGYRVVEVHSPYPLKGIEEIIGRRESPVRFWSFIGGIIGLVAGFGITIWMSLDWPLYTGGKPIVSLPPFLIIAFELTLLLGTLGTIIGFMFHSRLPSIMKKQNLTGDQFGMSIIEKIDKIKSLESLLSSLGARDIWAEDWTGFLPPPILSKHEKDMEDRGKNRVSIATPTLRRGKQSNLAFIIMAMLGIISFLIGISGAGTQRAWQIYLVNLLYWTGISLGGVLFTAILVITKAEWTKELKIIGMQFFPFIPLSLILFLLTYFGREYIFPWVNLDIGEKGKFLNIPFLYIRNIFRWVVLSTLSWIFVRNFRYGNFNIARDCFTNVRNDKNRESLRGAIATKQSNLIIPATILIIVFMFAFSFIGIDLVMSLSPEWVSTLFGGYFAIGAFYNGLAFIMLWTLVFRVKVDDSERTDMGKLIFGFSLFWASLFWAQYLVIWYGNIPEETGFVYHRLSVFPWKGLSWTVIVLNFFLPFLLLLGRYAKANRGILFAASTSITLGFLIERFVLIVPSISVKPSFGVIELLVSTGFLGVFLLCTRCSAFRENS